MKILVVGTGAREHALVRALSLDPAVTELHAAPGNPGIGLLARLHAVDQLDGAAVAELAGRVGADLVVVGPEAPLVAGVADAVRAAGIAAFGPSAAAAQLEGSKAFAKEVMAAAGVPTAEPRVATTVDAAAAGLDTFGPPYVVKDDGLAAGKGVVVTNDRAEALAHAADCLAKPGGTVVIEEYLDGPEISLFVLSDGVDAVPLVPAQDFKRVRDGDEGPNTGGMGAYSPLPWAPHNLVEDVMNRVARPTIAEMARRGTPFAGVLYVGLAMTSKGVRVVEFNARFGDPETQVVLPRMATPLAGVLYAAATGTLGALPPLEWLDAAAVTIVVASGGYPGTVRSGDPITGIEDAEAVPGVHVLHAGTALRQNSAADDDDAIDGAHLVAAGGRVLSVVGVGSNLAAARAAAYAGVEQIELPYSHHRNDIAASAADGPLV
ncbi:phosphoribosylamine--glycine ligase [Cellulomonas sp. URHD0024]|uniref:phosphoribosylamine--glycine ligase n=1 Tax=Cellulomonas sp. URHD0024 TaxID=1302620 RepID=UPI00040EAF87|nr:phosphoribosylamine--glycine ligase [Cellulomonas sp. URHD0024]